MKLVRNPSQGRLPFTAGCAVTIGAFDFYDLIIAGQDTLVTTYKDGGSGDASGPGTPDDRIDFLLESSSSTSAPFWCTGDATFQSGAVLNSTIVCGDFNATPWSSAF